MRKLLLSLATLLCYFVMTAQVSETEAAFARQLVSKNSTAIGLSATDVNNSIVSATYKVPGTTDLQMVYLQQSYQNIPVFNELQVLAFKNGQLVSNAGSRISGIDKKVNVSTPMPAVTVLGAVQNALTDAKLPILEQIVPIATLENGRKFEFGRLGVAAENINAELMWFPLDDQKGKLRLAWQVFLAPSNSIDYWLVRVDAMTGAIISKQNLTITCNWDDKKHSIADHIEKRHTADPARISFAEKRKNNPNWEYRPFVVNTASYKVVKYPAESPQHTGGTPSLHVDPWLMAGGNATSLGWHNDGTVIHDSTRGNNVWAQEDRDNNNSTFGKTAISTTPQPTLTFDFTYDFTKSPIDPTSDNQKAAITNLFYWNNLMHDMSYLYGFTEVTGNFQNSNEGRGGAGADYVIADAQDAGGTNNANFSTPVDGTRPRMQMYLWTTVTPNRDGDLDNGIVAHEYTHGISNRLTGGPANSSCLGNGEHGGEGWSDYYGLMITTNWATATINDGFNIPRGIGTYALNQPTTGPGIRSFRYCTNMAVNPLVYQASLPTAVHDRGEYWCMALWEMTWEIIQQAGINPNIFNPATVGGNSIALKLVTEGMRLQPCSPGFIDARNAILRADTLFFGAQYSCAIWKAFAKRGMGRGASQGSSGSAGDQIPSFVVDNGIFTMTQAAPAVNEGQNNTYINKITAGACSPLTNAFITDTLPTNVTYVSGGTYNAGNRTITFGPINLASNSTATYPFTVTVNNGTYFPPVTLLDETVPTSTIPAAWTPSSTSATVWTTTTTSTHSAPNAFFAPDPVILSEHSLTTTGTYTLNATASSYTTLSFWHRWITEDGWDGGVVEISTNGGGTWADLGSKMKTNGYNGSLGVGSALANRSAFTGTNTTWTNTTINLASYAGQNIKIRFRFASDDNTAPAGGGWWVDDISIINEPAVSIKSNLYSATNVLLGVTDTITRILPNLSCVPAAITTNPADATACAGNNATFTVAATGTAPITYQWQVNSGSGFANISNSAPYSGVNTATLTVTGVTTGLNGYQYRVLVSNGCAAPTSTAGTLTVAAVATISAQPANVTTCAGLNTSITVGASGATGYQWQVNTGTGFTNITNNATYGGATTATLTITGATAAMNTYQYRVILTSCGPSLTSNAAILSVVQPVALSAQPANATVCQNSSTTLTVTATGAVTGYQWQVSTDGGTTWINVAGATAASYVIDPVMLAQSGYRYRAVVTGGCNSVTSAQATLTVTPVPVFTLGTTPSQLCISDPATPLSASPSTGTWSGPGVTGSTFVPSAAGVGAKTVTYTLTSSGCSSAQSFIVNVSPCPERNIRLNAPNSLQVYPNPSSGQFNIRVNTVLYTRLRMRVYDIVGQLVADQAYSNISYGTLIPVDFRRLASGVYHLSFTSDEGGKTVKRTIRIVIARPK